MAGALQRPLKERNELSQEQEVHRYFRPWLSAHGSAFSVASNVDSIAKCDLQELGYRARKSRDRTLSAFAQLAALRLNVRRAMISLIDSKHQYVLTEATRTQSCFSEGRGDDTDALWLGNAILNRDDAVCHHCFYNTYTARDPSGSEFTARGLVVDDCRLDERFKNHSYVQAEPGVRFYAGVPIVSRDGHAIGAYAVSDDLPRAGLRVDELRYMHDVASSIMEHLEWATDRVDRYKSERLVRGLASFIDRSRPTQSAQPPLLTHQTSSVEDPVPSPGRRFNRGHIGDLVADFGPGRRSAFLGGGRDTPTSDSENEDGPSDASSNRSVPLPNAEEEDLDEILTRAAKSLRKSSLADGVLFFKAQDEPLATQQQATTRPSVGPQGLRDGRWWSPEVMAAGISLEACQDAQSEGRCALSEQTLTAYYEHFPDGKAFYFTADGEEVTAERDIADNVAIPLPRQDGRGVKRRMQSPSGPTFEHTEVIEKIAGIRKLIFLPLRDFVTGKWIAAGFLWTTSFGKMMNMGDDLPHLKAYANGIVSEIVRMNVEQLSRSKTAFIASMSHELRSPLHGILGSVEFINDTPMDSHQSSLITSIANCSRTLLDTLSNLLSYAKVSRTQTAAATASIDLALLVEEVVEAVCAGHSFRKQHTAHGSSVAGNESPLTLPTSATSAQPPGGILHARSLSSSIDVAVTLDIGQGQWHLITNPGAFRRIVMNLIGNALKYTTAGSVSVSLSAAPLSPDSLQVELSVKDTGRGISAAFIRNNLYTPFKQEDARASGTGLGLSIVKQLVESLGGEISVLSILGNGTDFRVKVPMRRAEQRLQDVTDGEDLDKISDIRHQTEALRVAVFRTSTAHTTSQPEPNDSKPVLENICSAWFGMEVLPALNQQDGKLDVVIFDMGNAKLLDMLDRHKPSGIPMAIVVLGVGAEASLLRAATRSRYDDLAEIVEVIAQPCGPRKLCSALERCLDRLARRDKTYGGDETMHDGHAALDRPHTMMNTPALFTSTSGSSDIGNSTIPAEDIPQLQATLNGSSASSGPPATDGAPQRRVLLVDDNKVNMDLLVRFVTKFSLAYTQAHNGLEAVAAFKAATKNDEGFDYILMDVSMPLMDGLTATRHIRAIEDGRAVKRKRAKVVALSAHESETKADEAKDAGVDLYLSKPVRFAKLKTILESDFV